MPTPSSTYRLQFRAEFGFDDAAAIVPYLAALGVTHVYASPYLQAAPGSTHGYDVVDHSRVNDELGGAAAHERFLATLEQHGLGQILDIVPNHMAIPGRENAWWWDVLKHGPKSRFARYFDIDWNPPEDKLRNTVLMPVLGDHYGVVLEAGDLQVAQSHGELVVRYFENEFPLDPATTAALTTDEAIADVNKSPDELDALLNAQNYRLAFWRVAGEEVDYRRFFDINSLVAIRTEDPEVFEATHKLVAEWLRTGVLDGVRIDHIDGLLDPAQYLFRLRKVAGDDAWIVAEKITEAGERIPATWPIAGTTGYDALNRIDGLFVDPSGEQSLSDTYSGFIGADIAWEDYVREGKTHAAHTLLASDVDRLTKLFTSICERHRRYRDYTRSELRAVLAAVLIAFPVYRSYVSADAEQVTQADRAAVDQAIATARASNEELDADLLRFFGDILTLEVSGDLEGDLAVHFQQLSGPVMAKGVEDTAFYRYFRLSSRNEVGGDPSVFSVRPDDFHEMATEAQRLWPNAMIASTTHDTKRSEDVRHRINVPSEIPEQWASAVQRWSALTAHLRRPSDPNDPDAQSYPDRNTEYLIYQTLVGAYPISTERLADYVAKATKEAKLFTTWTEANVSYDDAVKGFIEGVCSNADFLADLEKFLVPVIAAGRMNSLSATAVKLTMPGVPDTYQGTELWDLSLVDPDNRRPVDYEQRKALLEELDAMTPAQILERMDEGLPKLHVIRESLRLRACMPDAFAAAGSYVAVHSQGKKAQHVIAFARGHSVVTVVPRFTNSLQDDWEDTAVKLPEGSWRNIFTGHLSEGRTPMAGLLQDFPVAVMERIDRVEPESKGKGQP